MPLSPLTSCFAFASSGSLSERNREASWSICASMVTSTTSDAFDASRSNEAGSLISCATTGTTLSRRSANGFIFVTLFADCVYPRLYLLQLCARDSQGDLHPFLCRFTGLALVQCTFVLPDARRYQQCGSGTGRPPHLLRREWTPPPAELRLALLSYSGQNSGLE